MNIFLKMKHWQIFLLLTVFSCFSQIAIVSELIKTNDALLLKISMIMTVIIFSGWVWAAGNNLNKLVPSSIKMNIRLFRVAFTFLIIYFVFIALFSRSIYGININPVYLTPLLFVCLISGFYCLYFIAKQLKTIETQREVSFNDFAGEFFLMWFFPIGIWIIQPRLNKLMIESSNRPS